MVNRKLKVTSEAHIIALLDSTVPHHRFSNWVPNDPELLPTGVARDEEGLVPSEKLFVCLSSQVSDCELL